MNRIHRLIGSLGCVLALGGCATPGSVSSDFRVVEGNSLRTYRDGDDLLSAGLGLAGLRQAQPPALADPMHPTAAELRRRAIWANWRGIADLGADGFGVAYAAVPPVPGRELHARLRLPGAKQPFRVMLQLPDSFDPAHACLVTSASSGSRGIYGAIALAGGWGLPRGCAVAYTDKGAGTEWTSGSGSARFTLEGVLAGTGDPAAGAAVTVPHAHSGDNPEAHWGEHVRAATRWALSMIDGFHPRQAPFTPANTRIIATGVSNGGGAVLQAAGLPPFGLDGVVAVSPNILAGAGGRPLFDYVSEAALWMPCALQAPRFAATPFAGSTPAGTARCGELAAAGELRATTLAGQAEEALAHLQAQGWSERAVQAGALSVALDLWRAVGAGYASAYLRRGAGDMPCGYRYGVSDAQGQPRAASAIEQQLWWSDSSGIPPGAGVQLLDPPGRSAFEGLRCLRALWQDDPSLRAAVAATRGGRPPADLPIRVIHGVDDGLVPLAFSAAPWAAWVRQQPNRLQTRWVESAQHFDALVGLPQWQGRYRALLPEAYRELDALFESLPAK